MTRRPRSVTLAAPSVSYRRAYEDPRVDVEAEALTPQGAYAGGKIEVEHATALDPVALVSGVKRERAVARNRRTDTLQFEFSCGRISPGAFQAGRVFQRVAERAGKISWGSQGFEPSVGAGDRDVLMAKRIAAMEIYVEWSRSLRQILKNRPPPDPALVIEGVLIDCRTLCEQTTHMGFRGWRHKNQILKAFRDGLEEVACEWERCGFP